MKLTPQQWIGIIAVLVVVNLVVFGSLIWLVATELEPVPPGPVAVELAASPTVVARVTPTLRPTFTPTPGAAQPTPTETPVPSSTPVPASTDTATAKDTLTPTPTDTVAPTDTPMPVPTDTPTLTSTPAPTSTPTNTLTPVPTDTLTPTSTLTSTSTPTATVSPTATPTATLTPIPTSTATATSTPRPTVAPVAEAKVLSASSDRIDLSWKPAMGSESMTYHIYWDMGLGLGLYTYKTSVKGTRYSDLNLRPGTTYRYLIVTYDGSYESLGCEVLATTRARPDLVAVATYGPAQTARPSPSRRPTATPTSTPSRTPTPFPTRRPTATPTPTASPSPTSTPGRTSTPSPTWQPTSASASSRTPWPSPTRRRIVATPTPLPPDTVLLGLMSSHEYEDDLGFFTIVGEVRNDLQMNVGKVLVMATFYNASGDVIEEVSASTMVDILLPGQRSPFMLTLPRPVDLWEYSLRITARPTLEQPLTGLEVVQSDAYEDEVGFYRVKGQVENSGPRTADRVQVIVTLYDKWGKIVNAGFVYSEPRRLRSGEKAVFDCSFNYYPLVKEHVIQVERD